MTRKVVVVFLVLTLAVTGLVPAVAAAEDGAPEGRPPATTDPGSNQLRARATIAGVLARLSGESVESILRMRAAGANWAQIAEELGLTAEEVRQALGHPGDEGNRRTPPDRPGRPGEPGSRPDRELPEAVARLAELVGGPERLRELRAEGYSLRDIAFAKAVANLTGQGLGEVLQLKSSSGLDWQALCQSLDLEMRKVLETLSSLLPGHPGLQDRIRDRVKDRIGDAYKKRFAAAVADLVGGEDALRSLLDAGYGLREIVPAALMAKISAENLLAIIGRHDEGMSWAEIGQELGVSAEDMRRAAQEYLPKPPQPRQGPPQVEAEPDPA